MIIIIQNIENLTSFIAYFLKNNLNCIHKQFVMENKIFLSEDWHNFTATQHLNIQKFINKNAIDLDSHASVYEYLNNGCHNSDATSAKWDLGELSVSESEVYNAILEFRHICYKEYEDETGKKYSMASLINPLMNAFHYGYHEGKEDRQVTKDAINNSETIIGNIMLYFGFDTKYLREENCIPNKKAVKLSKTLNGGNYSKFDEMFRWLLEGYKITFPPLTITRLCRNMIHPQDREVYDPLYGNKSFLESIYPEKPGQARKIIEFLIFTYIGIITICRKLLNKLADGVPAISGSNLNEDNIVHYCKVSSKQNGLNNEEREELAASISSYIIKLKDNILGNLSQFTPGETLSLDIHGQGISSVKWTLGDNRSTGDRDQYGLKITGAFRYEPIEINIITENGNIRFNNIKVDSSHYSDITIVLDCQSKQYEIRSTKVEKHMIEAAEEEERVSLKVKSDLDGTIMVDQTTKDIRQGQYAEIKVSKGEHTITLTSAKNHSYSIKRTINIANDTTLDLLFAYENHREWWKIEDIVTLKQTIGGKNYFILWDSTVDIPVYKCYVGNSLDGGDGKLEDYDTGFAGNLFYIYNRKQQQYKYHDLTDPQNNQIHAGHLFTFKNGYELSGYNGGGDALVIDENGKTLYTIFKFKDCNEKLKSIYKKFVWQFTFSENWAAMLQKDATIRFINKQWIEDESHNYNYDPDKLYPMFHNGYCAVRKGDKYIFLKDHTTFIKELPDEYESLRVTKLDNDIVYIGKRDGKYGLISSDLQIILPFEYDKIEIISEHYIIVKGEHNGNSQSILCIKGKELLRDCDSRWALGIAYPNWLAARSTCQNKWIIFSPDGKKHLDDVDEIRLHFSRDHIAVKRNGLWEIWRHESGNLSKVMEVRSGRPLSYIAKYDVYKIREKNLYRFFNKDGTQIITYTEKFGDEYYIADNDGIRHIIDSSGNKISNDYIEIRNIVNGHAAVKDISWKFLHYANGRFEEINTRGYYAVHDFTEEGYAMVRQKADSKWGLIDTNGNLVIPCNYDHIDPFKCRYTSVKEGTYWKIINKEDNKDIKIN